MRPWIEGVLSIEEHKLIRRRNKFSRVESEATAMNKLKYSPRVRVLKSNIELGRTVKQTVARTIAGLKSFRKYELTFSRESKATKAG